jgi:7-keto-8-aminopelargonate synthetase-like enzyme
MHLVEDPRLDQLGLLAGIRGLGLMVLGGVRAIASILVEDELTTLRAARELFEQGYYVQSVIFPGVPHQGGVLRVQINANHRPESIIGLVEAIADLVTSGRFAFGGAPASGSVAALTDR